MLIIYCLEAFISIEFDKTVLIQTVSGPVTLDRSRFKYLYNPLQHQSLVYHRKKVFMACSKYKVTV